MITCALWDIESLEFDRTPFGPRGLLSNSWDSTSHSTHVIIVCPIQSARAVFANFRNFFF